MERQEGESLKSFRQINEGQRLGERAVGERGEEKGGRKEKGEKESKCILFPDEAHI